MSAPQKRILFLSPGCELGGAEIVLLSLLRRIRKHSFDCWLVVPETGELTDRAGQIPGVHIAVASFPSDILNMRRNNSSPYALLRAMLRLPSPVLRLKQFVDRGGFDLIYTNSVKAHIYGSIVGALADIPVVWRAHDVLSPMTFDGKLIRALGILANMIPRKILCVSDAVAESYEQAGVSRAKLVTVYNGMDIGEHGRDACAARQEFNVPASHILVGWFGRITPWKGLEVFLDAASRVLHHCTNVRFLVVGGPLYESGAYSDKIIRDGSLIGDGTSVTFAGYRHDPLRFMAGVDILVHTSVAPDPLPTVLLEGASLGKAMIATNIGGVPEILKDGSDGILIPPAQPEALYQAILDLISHPDKRAKLGQASRLRASEKFSLETYVNGMEKEISAILAPKTGPSGQRAA